MIADTQVHIDSWGVWPVYFLGHALHALSVANAAVRSKTNAIASFRAYFSLRWVPLASRLFLSGVAFVLVYDNDAIVDMDKYIGNAKEAVAMAGILGFFSDSVLDKVLNLFAGWFPGLQKELPVVESQGRELKQGDGNDKET